MRICRLITPVVFLASIALGRMEFDGEFAPHQGLVAPVEQPQRQEICLNGTWEFQGMETPKGWKRGQGTAPDLPQPSPDGWDDVKIKIPSPWNVNGYKRSDGPDHYDFPSYPADWEKYEMAWMKKTVAVPADWKDKQLFLHFEAVAGFSEVYVNGHKVAENFDLFLPFEANITAFAEPGGTVEILVGVRHHKLFNKETPAGRRIVPAGSMWGQYIAGIWQDVYLFARPAVRVDDVFVEPLVSKERLELEVTLKNDSTRAASVNVGGTVQEWINLAGKGVVEAPVSKWELGAEVLKVPAVSATVAAGGIQTVMLSVAVKDRLKRWSPAAPNLYGLTLSLNENGQVLDKKYQRFGWREWTFDGTKMLLNGEMMELRGDAWHFQGVPQMTRRYAWAWYTLIKDANGNAVRLHAQVYPRFYLDMADEMGLCVLNETANWASDGGPLFDRETFWRASDEHLERFVKRDRNHPSVFGWSLTNENRPIIMNVFNRPDLMPVQVAAWARWVDLCRDMDPTRPWISGDGDRDGEGTLPTVVGHYGNEGSMKEWSSFGKPWGIGEHSMAYYGTPKQVSKYNGDRAYESVLGRMEGLAYECYDLIRMARKYDASYISVFNLVWYALQPLALGLPDPTRAPTLDDGIFLTAQYVEGKPGMQPERIGPYSTTLNPGYDPALPLYKPWPMFDAIKAANAPGGPVPSKWDTFPAVETKTASAPASAYSAVVFMGGGASSLKARLAARGVDFSNHWKTGPSVLAMVDGSYAVSAADVKKLNGLLNSGGDVWIWGITPQTEAAFNKLLPNSVEVTHREASSLLVKSAAQIVSGLGHSDFYFSEIQKIPAMEYGLAGPFVEKGEVILEACPANWRRWNKVEESIKTAALLRSEREAKESGVAMAVSKAGKGEILINTMTSFYQTDPGFQTLIAMLNNAGVPMHKIEMDMGGGVFDIDGNLKKALVIGSFSAADDRAAFDTDFLGDEAAAKPLLGDEVGGRLWKEADVTANGDLNFKQMGMEGPMNHSAAYVSFWLWSPRPLDDLLIEPDMPKLDLIAGADDGHKIWLNGKIIAEKYRTGPANLGEIECKTLPLKQGWNHFLIKVSQGGGNWQLFASLKCSNYEFMGKLKAATENPAQK